MDLSNMLNLFNQNTNKNTQQSTQPTSNLYPELLDIKPLSTNNAAISTNNTLNTQTVNSQTTNTQDQNTQSGFNLPFNLNPDMLKMIQQILPLLSNSSGGTNILSSLLGSGNPLSTLLGGNKKNSVTTDTQSAETESHTINIDELVRIDDF